MLLCIGFRYDGVLFVKCVIQFNVDIFSVVWSIYLVSFSFGVMVLISRGV